MTGWINQGKHYGNYDYVLHTNEDCMYVTDDSIRPEEANVDPDELDVCDYCAGRMQGKETPKRECPFCPEMIKDLPDHLPCEESP